MKKLKLTKIEYIKEFLKTKGFTWNGKIRDLLLMRFRFATLEDFASDKMIRLVVTTPTNKDEFIQRVIISDTKFKIENLNLKKLDNFEDFSPEWVELLKTKIVENTIVEQKIEYKIV